MFSGNEASNVTGWSKTAIFSMLSMSVSLEALELKPELYSYHVVPHWLFADTKTDDLEYIEWPFYVCECSFCTFCRRIALFLLCHIPCCLSVIKLS